MSAWPVCEIIEAWLALGCPLDDDDGLTDAIAEQVSARVLALPAWKREHAYLASIDKAERTAEQRERLRELATRLSPDTEFWKQHDPVLRKLGELAELLDKGRALP